MARLSNVFKNLYSRLVAFEPTGWTHGTKKAPKSTLMDTGCCILKNSSKRFRIYGVPYSEHSSFLELREMVQWAQSDRIIPTVSADNEDHVSVCLFSFPFDLSPTASLSFFA